MAVDLDAIRKKIQQLTGNRSSSIQMWKPGVGEYKVRGLPWKDSDDGQPLKELWFYYIGDTRGFLAPYQFGKPDPIKELINKLYSSGKPDEKALAKKLQPKMRAYMPVIVRGEEDKGVQVYAFGKPIYTRLLGFWVDEEVGDVLDPKIGFDLKVSITHPPGKMFNGKPSLETQIDAARKPSKLHDDPEQAKKWLDSVPDIMDMYPLKSAQEIETILNNWLNGGSDSKEEKEQSGGQDELDKLAEDLKSSSSSKDDKEEKKLDKQPKEKAKAKKPTVDLDDDDAPKKSSASIDLDEAFDQLSKDDNDDQE